MSTGTPVEIQTLQAGSWLGARYRFDSQVLGKESYFCRLNPQGIKRPRGSLYILHGGNGDDQQALQLQLPQLIPNDLLKRLEEQELQIVCPFVGTSFLHAHPDGGKRDWTTYFLNEILGLCEADSSTNSDSRWISGFSMGGQAALNIFLRYPENFRGVGAHFATLVDFNWSDPSAAESFFKRNGVGEPWNQVLIQGFQDEFCSISDFASHDPIALVKNLRSPEVLKGKRIYFDVGARDEFGLAEGGQALSRALASRQTEHVFECVPEGRHDAAFAQSQFPKLVRSLFT